MTCKFLIYLSYTSAKQTCTTSFPKCIFPQMYLVSACTGAISITPTPRPVQISCISQGDSVFRPAQTARYKYHLGLAHVGSKQNHSENSGWGPNGIQHLCPHFHPKKLRAEEAEQADTWRPESIPVSCKSETNHKLRPPPPAQFLILQWLH